MHQIPGNRDKGDCPNEEGDLIKPGKRATSLHQTQDHVEGKQRVEDRTVGMPSTGP